MRARMWGLSAAIGLLAACGTVATVSAVEPVAGGLSLSTMFGDGGSSGRDELLAAAHEGPDGGGLGCRAVNGDQRILDTWCLG